MQASTYPKQEFKVQRSPRQFFIVGKVFKVLWPELAGDLVGDDASSFVSDGKFGEAVVTKIRWFVVVKEGRESCSCR